MLRGSYADGSLAVTARCPCATTASVSAFASTAPSSGLSQVRPRRHPACPRPGSRPARNASQSRLHRYAATRSAELRHRHSRLCYSSAHQCRSLPSHGEAEQSKAFAFRRGSLLRHRNASRGLAKPFPRSAGPCCSVAMHCISKPLPSRALPSPCYALLRRRASNHGTALPSPCHVSLCLRQAMLRKATPSLPVSVHRRRMPRLCFAVALHSTALHRGAVAVRGPSWPSYPMPLRIGSLPVLRGAVRFAAPPSPIASSRCYAAAAQRHSKPSHAAHGIALPSPRSTSQCLFFADLGSAVHFHRLAEQIKAFPLPIPATHFLRSSRLSRASPTRGCAPLCSSFPSPP